MSEYVPGYRVLAPNYERPQLVSQLKPEPRVVAKVTRRRLRARMDVKEKEAVRVRDKESCRVCGKRTRDVHERLFKSLGGIASLENSICACRTCHPFLQEHGIKVIDVAVLRDTSRGHGCNGPLLFQMSAAVARMIFGAKATPGHVEIVATKETA